MFNGNQSGFLLNHWIRLRNSAPYEPCVNIAIFRVSWKPGRQLEVIYQCVSNITVCISLTATRSTFSSRILYCSFTNWWGPTSVICWNVWQLTWSLWEIFSGLLDQQYSCRVHWSPYVVLYTWHYSKHQIECYKTWPTVWH